MSTIEKVHKAQEARRKKRNRRSSRGYKAYSDEEKAAKRAEHAQLLDAALEAVATPEGALEWLRSREMNPDISVANVALAAYQLPGETVLTMAGIKANGLRVKKGQRSQGRISGKTGWPVAVWAASTLADWPSVTDPDPKKAIRLAKAVDMAYREFGRSVKTFSAAVEVAGIN